MELNVKKFPNKNGILNLISVLRNIFYPNLFQKKTNVAQEINKAKRLYYLYINKNQECFENFKEEVKKLEPVFEKDVQAIFDGDPAADSYEEIISVYPGFTAIFYYRIAHVLYLQGHKTVARLISEEAHFKTGVDIHPGATIGEYFMIDHGTGIVIGETTIIGDHARIYQGVTLGALSLSGGHKLNGIKRHPTIGNNVTIYSGASLLGEGAVIGDNVIIGCNVFLTEAIPANRRVTITKPTLNVIEKQKKKTD